MEREIFLWLGLMVVFLIIELATVGLTSIWFSGGALAALLVSLAGAGMVIQIAVFVVISAVLVIFTRPFAAKYVNVHHVKTNCDELIGSVVKVTETVDNFAQTGTAIAQGKEWTARCKSDKDRIEKDSLAKVAAILVPTSPDLPTPVTINLPFEFIIKSTAFSISKDMLAAAFSISFASVNKTSLTICLKSIFIPY